MILENLFGVLTNWNVFFIQRQKRQRRDKNLFNFIFSEISIHADENKWEDVSVCCIGMSSWPAGLPVLSSSPGHLQLGCLHESGSVQSITSLVCWTHPWAGYRRKPGSKKLPYRLPVELKESGQSYTVLDICSSLIVFT